MKALLVCVVVGVMACWAFSRRALGEQGIGGMAGLSAWYRADRVTRGPGKGVAALDDCSGKGRKIAAGPKAPAVVADVLNGRDVLRFQGGESPLVDAGHNWSAGGFTAFVVASYRAIPDKPAIRDNPRYIVDTPGEALLSDGGRAGLALGLNWSGRPGMTAGISLADPKVAYAWPYPNEQSSDLVIRPGRFYAFTYASAKGKRNEKANAWDCRLTVSVSANGTASSTVPTPFVSMQAMNGGKGLQIGSAGKRSPFKGDLAEIILFARELSKAERREVLSYLRAKYALKDVVLRLPAGPVVVAPTLGEGAFWFRDSVAVALSAATAGAEVRYTTDGTSPTKASPLYSAPVKLTASGTVKARAFAPGHAEGRVTAAEFIRIARPTPTARKLPGGWKYSWGDEFAGPSIDESVWGYEIGYVRNHEAQYYSKRRENSRIDNGHLLIRGLHDNWKGHKYTSASRSTENKVTLTFGRYELRARIDIRSGSWPAWWLWSRPDAAGWPKEGEIDMMEYYRGKCLFNVMDGAARWYRGNRRKSIASLGGDRWAEAFHVWTMDWTAEAIDLYLDGTRMVHYRVADADGTGRNGTNPFRNPQGKKMVINQALGGSSGGALKSADAPFELRVDWLRVHTWSDEPAHTLTVNGGAGSGPYVAGTKASVTARMPPAGYAFDRWVIHGGAAVRDAANPSAVLTMPASDVTATATYVPRPRP